MDLSVLFWIACLVLLILAIVDLIKRKMKQELKIVWIIVIIVLPVIGPILYWLIGRKR